MLVRFRALLLTTVATLAASACSSETVARPPPPPVAWRSLDVRPPLADAGSITPTERERAIADAYMKALGSPHFGELGRYLGEDAHFSFAGFRDVHGRDNVVRVHEALLGGFDKRTFVASRVLLTSSAQIIEWTMTGMHDATHKTVTFRGLTLLSTKDDGSIADVHLYFDEALAKAQLGVGPKVLVNLAAPTMPSGEREEVEQTASPAESANVAVIRASLEALESADEAAYVATMTDDVEFKTLESAKPMRGRGEARGYLKSMHKAIGQLDTAVDNVWAIGPYVVVEYHIVGEQRGPLGWVPAQKDNLLKMFLVDVAEMRGAKIARVSRYDDPAQILSEPLRDP